MSRSIVDDTRADKSSRAQENELTNTKSTSSFKGASSEGIVLNADYVNSRLGKTVATPLITDSSLLSQNNPVDKTIFLNNVSSTDKFLHEVDDDERRTEIDGETQKLAQAIHNIQPLTFKFITVKGEPPHLTHDYLQLSIAVLKVEVISGGMCREWFFRVLDFGDMAVSKFKSTEEVFILHNQVGITEASCSVSLLLLPEQDAIRSLK
ncbi:unnamed protein product [Timema podura]|uniref:Uncharacterized protein n=1 Tax=Timema podura TaxID=61482 RepID=A0ABN7P0A8_TIMPD|nr:unnamed protein product [Timema podura]